MQVYIIYAFTISHGIYAASSHGFVTIYCLQYAAGYVWNGKGSRVINYNLFACFDYCFVLFHVLIIVLFSRDSVLSCFLPSAENPSFKCFLHFLAVLTLTTIGLFLLARKLSQRLGPHASLSFYQFSLIALPMFIAIIALPMFVAIIDLPMFVAIIALPMFVANVFLPMFVAIIALPMFVAYIAMFL